MRFITIVVILFSLSGCSILPSSLPISIWPPEGQGGIAEHHLQTLIPIDRANKPLDQKHGLRFDLELASRHLDMLVLEGAKLCFPASVVRAKLRQNRISRELHGNLSFDAANDIIILRNQLSQLERRLDYVKKEGACVVPTTTNKKPKITSKPKAKPIKTIKKPRVMKSVVTINTISDLLNADNQFAIDSSEINPKYLVRLSKAVKLLKQFPGAKLLVAGHADNSGTEKRNQQLSLERAEQVGQHLQNMGFPEERIKLYSIGSSSPLFKGEKPHVKLVNRRVSIELIENNTQNVNQ